jgi:hypothetical protein
MPDEITPSTVVAPAMPPVALMLLLMPARRAETPPALS